MTARVGRCVGAAARTRIYACCCRNGKLAVELALELQLPRGGVQSSMIILCSERDIKLSSNIKYCI